MPEDFDPSKVTSISKLLEERRELEKQDAEQGEKRQNLARLKRDVEMFEGDANRLKNEEVDLEDRLKALRIEIEKTDDSQLIAMESLKLAGKEMAKLPFISFNEIDERITKAEGFKDVVALHEQKKRAESDLEAVEKNHEAYNQKLDDLADYKQEVLAGAKFPVDGLSIDEDGGIVFEGQPLSQRGKSKQILVGCHVCAAQNPKLRVMLIDDGNALDASNMEVLQKFADENDFQVFIIRVSDTAENGSYHIVDGMLEDKKETADLFDKAGK